MICSWEAEKQQRNKKKGHKWEFHGREEPEDTRREIKMDQTNVWTESAWMRLKGCECLWVDVTSALCASGRPRWTGSPRNSPLSPTATRSASDPNAAIVQPSSTGDNANVAGAHLNLEQQLKSRISTNLMDAGADRKWKNPGQQFHQPPLTLNKPNIIIFIDVIESRMFGRWDNWISNGIILLIKSQDLICLKPSGAALISTGSAGAGSKWVGSDV